MKNLVIISHIAMFLAFAFSAFSQVSDDLRLERLFSEAMEKDGLEYGRIRDEIISGEDAKLFLAEKAKSTNVFERVISRSMMTWRDNAATNDWRVQAMKSVVGDLAGAVNFPDNICGAVSVRGGGLFDLDEPPSNMIMLVETALKGTTFEPEGRRLKMQRLADERLRKLVAQEGKNWSEMDIKHYWENLAKTQFKWEGYLKCFAASLSGGYDDPDIPIVLESLVRESASDRMRECAFVGMSKTFSTNFIGVLLDGLADRDKNIRYAASQAVKGLTGQDFSGNREKYQALIQTHRVAEALPNLSEYIDVARRQLEKERIVFEKSEIKYMILRDEVLITVSPPGYITSSSFIVHFDRAAGTVTGYSLK